MPDDDPATEPSASESVTTPEASLPPDQIGPALAGESAADPRQTTVTSAEDAAAGPPPTGVKTGDIVGTSISLFFLLIALFCLIYFDPSSRLGTAGLAALFLLSFLAAFLYAAPLVGVLWPGLRRWKRAKLVAPGLGAAVLATGLVLALMQVLPSTVRAPTPPNATASAPPSTSSSLLVV
jgi:hypothetical protein